ncbi:LamG-like jellyroll fold domain-containing protein [Brumimicrobium mesophilum]|uniref:LamG-like jellyroll fold domain-containing protein n=1 Tax=Brumimicrobium mesophilum TaxID=392717 RepID=UPI000D143F5E|nr:LamG-like jellyroll fold domain-containing protein [Brumimicrobium mesophilum]
MKNKLLKPILALAFLVIGQFSFGQNPGDTTVVQAFNFNSVVRDTQIVFPQLNGNEVERIWMKYTMRCKDGLVSPGISGQTNIGCGEWDYSCNTYITDSTRLDSIKAQINNYIVYPYASPNDKYSTTGSYNIYENEHYDVQISSTTNESNADITASGAQTSSVLSNSNKGGRSFVLLTNAQLTSAGLTAGDIDALSLYSNGSTGTLGHFVLKVKEVTFSNLETSELSDLIGGTEVFHGDWTLTNGQNKIPFYQAFNWTGNNNLLIEIVSSSNNMANAIDLEATDVSNQQSWTNSENQFANFFTGNYVKANTYQGIAGSTERTVEAWIKTEGTNETIVYWGTNTQGNRFTIRIDSDGRPRLEISSGSIRGDYLINDGEWHHLAITTEGVSLTGTKMYVDGVQLTTIDLVNQVLNTTLGDEVRISRGHNNFYFTGGIDDVRIWDTKLTAATIQENYSARVDASHPNYANLQLNYVFEGNSSAIEDLSPNNNDGTMINATAYGQRSSSNHIFDFTRSSVVPDITFHQADYVLNIVNTQEYDSILKDAYTVEENVLDPANGTYTSDIVTTYQTYYPDSNTVYGLSGVATSTVAQDIITLNVNVIDYALRSPSRLEILSLVTPYGINLDLGIEGVAWYFDVTDFYPILQGNRGLEMTGGGQWQEDIDIQFLYVHGTPTREVLDLRQIWRVDKKSFAAINSNDFFEPRTIDLPTNTAQAKISSAVTGHGQEGEFIPRQHYMNINNGQQNFQWQVWMTCGENPIYPQGGTWIYDRAGWCPGMPTQVEEFDVTSYINNNQIDVDYGITTASGTSNYIVNNQIIAYGPTNFTTDARIVTVQAPNDQISFGRTNPMCGDPVVTVQNSGSNDVTSMTITYSINGGSPETYDWTGTLSFLEKEDIVLPSGATLWNSTIQGSNNFEASISTVNGSADEYVHNNSYKSTFTATDIVEPFFILEIKTNSTASQNKYRIEDTDGNIIMERTSLSNNTTYNDTLALTRGCYRFVIEDTGGNGIDFWANNEGTGSMRIKKIAGNQIKRFEGDFGSSFIYEFSITSDVSTSNQSMYAPSFTVSPIPANDFINIDIKGSQEGTYSVFNAQGQSMKTGTIKELKENSSISIRDWDATVYFIHFNTAEKTTVQKFIKN